MDFMCLSGSPAEGTPEEPGDEGTDGSDEEPAVGCQRHADAQEVKVQLNPLSSWEMHSSTDVRTANWQSPGEIGEFLLDFEHGTTFFIDTPPLWLHFITDTHSSLAVHLRNTAVCYVLY